MKTKTIFYAWQSDDRKTKNFVESALTTAINNIRTTLTFPIDLDKDTLGVPGAPPIFDTILSKIDACSVFVADLTFIGETRDRTKSLSNPNVLVEYGYALREKSYARLICVMNTAYGGVDPTELPFDMRHVRSPIQFNLPKNADDVLRQKVKTELTANIEQALLAILTSIPTENTHKEIPHTLSPSRFLKVDQELGMVSGKQVFVPNHSQLFLRLIPIEPLVIGDKTQAYNHLENTQIISMREYDGGNDNYIRNEFGAATITIDKNETVSHFLQLFLNGELWCVHANSLHITVGRQPESPYGYFPCEQLETIYKIYLPKYVAFYRNTLQYNGPLKLYAGATNVRYFQMTAHDFQNKLGKFDFYTGFGGQVVDDHIVYDAVIKKQKDILRVLGNFFVYVWKECGLEYPEIILKDRYHKLKN